MSERKYWLFACDQYYPSGGDGDLHEVYDTEEEAEAAKAKVRLDAAWIVPVENNAPVPTPEAP